MNDTGLDVSWPTPQDRYDTVLQCLSTLYSKPAICAWLEDPRTIRTLDKIALADPAMRADLRDLIDAALRFAEVFPEPAAPVAPPEPSASPTGH